MNELIRQAAKAKLILVPKGDDSRPCIRAFEDATGIGIPEFKGRRLEARAGGRTFLKVKGRDIPRFIAAGYGDMGLTGSDSCDDYAASDDTVVYEPFGPKMCRFVLLAPVASATTVRRQLNAGRKQLKVATSFPDLLTTVAAKKNLPLRPVELPICGSVEVMPRLLGVPLVADLVSSGATAKANGLAEVITLMDVYPAVIARSSDAPAATGTLSYGDIERIDRILADRNLKVSDMSTKSYTLALMRNANEAGKKAGEEFGEVMMAIAGNGDTADCESEIADLTYAQLVAAYSRGKPAKLTNVIRILVDRNQNGGDS